MPAKVDQLFLDALALPLEVRAELTDWLVASAAEALDPEIESAHLEEVRQRIARVETGATPLIPGEQVLGEGRALLSELSGERRDR